MRFYWYCEDCNVLIHNNDVSHFDGNEACPHCRNDLEHSEDYDEDNELYFVVKRAEESMKQKLNIINSKVGCGKDIPTGLPGIEWSCTRPCGSDPKQLCKECVKNAIHVQEENK